MKLDEERLRKYLDEIAAETIDMEKVLGKKGKKRNDILQDPHIFRFRNMLVHQYWRVDNRVFVKNLKNGLNDFRIFVNEIKKIINEASAEIKENDY